MKGFLVLEDGSAFEGRCFGSPKAVSGEVVFNTGAVGYPESLTDPSYKGQILVLTYPLIGNYGVPSADPDALESAFESDRIHIQGFVVSQYSRYYSHWSAAKDLAAWLREHDVPALDGVDTRMVTKRLREKGSMLGKILLSEESLDFYDPNREKLVSQVSVRRPILYERGKKRLVVVDCGCKNNIIRSLLSRDITVIRVPWDWEFFDQDFDGVVISNGPGDPNLCEKTILAITRAIEQGCPILGICLGHQILALAAGARTYKLKFGHRSQNQPCIETGSQRCYMTSQNHGYAVASDTLPEDWETWFVNANDGTNEGIRHRSKPFMSVQFHPEAAPGPLDTGYVFNEFLSLL